MRVKISYGIDLEDLPEEVITLYDKVAQLVRVLERQSETAEELLGEEEHRSCLSIISKMRQTMGTVDARLEDISNILQGYVSYKEQTGESNVTSERGPAVDTTSSNVIQGSTVSDGSNVESGTESGDLS